MNDQVATIRRAAEKIRDRASSATDGKWLEVVTDWEASDGSYVYALSGDTSVGDGVGTEMDPSNAEHIASWDPTTARAVADLLDSGADEIARRVERDGPGVLDRANPVFHAMCELARTYLGDDA